MPRNTKVSEVMATDVLAFHPEDNVQDAMRTMVDRGFDGAPVIDADSRVVGLLSASDLIVQESRLHMPTVISVFGAYLELPSAARRFDSEIEKALGGTVGEVMHEGVFTIGPDESVVSAATALHNHDVSRLPVVDADNKLVASWPAPTSCGPSSTNATPGSPCGRPGPRSISPR